MKRRLLLNPPCVLVAVAVAALSAVACREDRTAVESPSDATTLATVVIDSILPMEEHLRRFRAGLARPDTLAFSSRSRAVLVRRFADALERRDTAALRAMHISRAEYAYLYFPGSRIARPPYELDPAIAWLQLTLESDKGIGRALRQLGGMRLADLSHACEGDRTREGSAWLHQRCRIEWRGDEGRQTAELFGAILEVGGRFKFLSYANAL